MPVTDPDGGPPPTTPIKATPAPRDKRRGNRSARG
jgi:hypothetical protein